MILDIKKNHVLSIAIIWFSILSLTFAVDYTVLASEQDNIVLIGEVQNPKSLGEGRSSFELIKASNPFTGQDFPVNQSIPVDDLPVIVREGQTLAIHRITDPVRFPFLHEPQISSHDVIYIDGKAEWSGQQSNTLFLVPSVLGIMSGLTVISIVILNRKNGDASPKQT